VKKSNKKPRQSKTRNKDDKPKEVVKTRRSFMSMAGTFGIAAVVIGGIGFWGVRTVQASVAERDLTQIGQGMPAIVQVHDPQCAVCNALQREARAALKGFDADQLDYRVADIKTNDGVAFAARYGASHSTLLLFDKAGELSARLVGPSDRDTLARAFASHVANDQ
jgi:hypothetical protein